MADTPTIRFNTTFTVTTGPNGHLTQADVTAATRGTGPQAAADVAITVLGPVAHVDLDALLPLGQWLADAFDVHIYAHGPAAHLIGDAARHAITTERGIRRLAEEHRQIIAAAQTREQAEGGAQ